MNEIITDEKIENMIYMVRGVEVMLDSDLAKLYHCANGTKDINKAVKRNIDRFPNDFYFQLTDNEKIICGSKMEPQILKQEQIHTFLLNKMNMCLLLYLLLTKKEE